MEIEYSKDRRSAKALSSKGDKWYEVTPSSCTCPCFIFRMRGKGICKHIKSAFYNVEQNFNLNEFRKGMDANEAYEKYGDEKIDSLIRMRELILIGRRLRVLE